MTVHDLPTLNAALNFISGTLLLAGYIQIKKGNRSVHKKIMLSALFSSLLFLTSYVIYHVQVGSVPYPYHDWTRAVYFIILVPHVILAAVMTPFIVTAVWFAWHERYDKHKRLVHWVWPVWMFVSVSGVTIYWMLYRL
jgi:putative membrane protein